MINDNNNNNDNNNSDNSDNNINNNNHNNDNDRLQAELEEGVGTVSSYHINIKYSRL